MYQLADVIPLFLKFTDEDYADLISKGNLRLRNLNYYREWEKTKGKGIGDQYDGSAILNDVIVKINSSGVIEEKFVSQITSQDKNFLEKPVFCVYRVDNSMLKYSTIKNGEVVFIPYLDDAEIEKIKDQFGKSVVIFSAGTFLDNFKKTCRNNGYGTISGNIEYYDSKINSKESLEMFLDPSHPKTCFRKDKIFSHQREYRFMLPNIEIEDYLDIKVNGLEGTVATVSVDQFFSGTLELRFPINE